MEINSAMDDWLHYVKSSDGKLGDELDLSQLKPGDVLTVLTVHSEYVLTLGNERDAILACSQPGRPSGPVRIMGCTFGQSSSIKPDHLFCGGNLELNFQRDGMAMTHTTTTINEIHLRREKP